jgi:pimeloyl-ACP methyl ester carboxylesterase
MTWAPNQSLRAAEPTWLARRIGRAVFGPRRVSPAAAARWIGGPIARYRGARPVRVNTTDGITIDALYLPPATHRHAGRRGHCQRRGKLPIVMTHGWFETKEVHLRAAGRLARMGHPVLLYDSRGHGRSTGREVTFGLREQLDVRAMVDHAQQHGLSEGPIIAAGHSMGAATMLMYAAGDQRVAGVIASSPFADLRSAIDGFRTRRLGLLPTDRWMGGLELAAGELDLDLDALCTVEAAGRLEVPVLVMAGGRDTLLVRRDHADRVARVIRPDLLHWFCAARARHFNITQPNWPGSLPAMARFLRHVRATQSR